MGAGLNGPRAESGLRTRDWLDGGYRWFRASAEANYQINILIQ